MLSIEDSIKKCLEDFTQEAVERKQIGLQYNKYWTDEILYSLANEGKQRGLEVFARKNFEEVRMPDLVWYNPKEGMLRSIPLFLMVEWRPSPFIEMRFEVLTNVKTHLRVCVLDSTFPQAAAGFAQEWAQNKIAELYDRALCFDMTEETDRYLFCVWCRDQNPGEWLFESYPKNR